MITHRTTLNAQAADRRGVLLLVVLILLVMFVLMAVTYVLLATRELSANKALATVDATSDEPQAPLDAALMQVVHGSTNMHSVLYPHSLLEHMYGPYTALGTLGNPITDSTGGQVVEFIVPVANLSPANSAYSLSSAALNYDGYLDGCLITMTSGQATGLTSRIVRYDVPATATASNPNRDPVFHILAFKGTTGSVTPQKNDTFVINGRAFSGTGFGYSGKTGSIDALDANNRPFAMLPNPIFYDPLHSQDWDPNTNPSYAIQYANNPNGIPFGGLGGCNTDYEAADCQHMYLSWSVMNSTTGLPQVILPSYHRPDLINYWNTTGGGVTSNPSLLRQIMLRPMGAMQVSGTMVTNPDHPKFTGSNPNFDAVNGPWDVDNDGDGVPDSVWLDLGDPVQTTSDGRLYKRLYAILCVDLDGRLNLNAHGTTEQIGSTHTQAISGPFAGGNSSVTLPRGEGDGPADVDLSAFGYSSSDISNLLHGGTVNGQTFPGRYGISNGVSTSEVIGSAEAGQTGVKNPLSLVEHFQFTDDLSNPPFSSFGSPADLWGRMAVGLDFRGQPLFWKPSWTNEAFINCPYNLNLAAEGSGYDAPFSVGELERILRPNDIDSADLPPRLWQLSGAATLASSGSTQALQRDRAVTTDSWDPPSPGVIAPDYLRNQLAMVYGRKFATNIVELLTARLLKENPSMSAAQINLNIRKLLSPELIAGLRMNVNRPLGDGRDGDNNGSVDEVPPPGKYTTATLPSAEIKTEGKSSSVNPWTWLDSSLASIMPAPPALDLVNGIDVNGDGVVDMNDQIMARQLLARHLYVLARLMIDDQAIAITNWFPNENLTDPEMKELAIRRIAQWAVNVVDFMDPNNIMTPFEYDMNPFLATDPTTGNAKDTSNPSSGRTWCVDGIIDDGTGTLSPDDNQTTHPWRRMVWGCTRPQLLLTETIAFHDRRVVDSAFDNGPNSGGGSGKTTTDTPPDPTFDQARIPQGSAFIELYATGNPNQPQQSKDLYDNSTGQWMLDLGKMAPADPAPANNTPAYPVWRLAITGPDSNQKTPANDVQTQTQVNSYYNSYSYDSETYANATSPSSPLPAGLVSDTKATNPIIERVVWFTDTDPAAGYPTTGNNVDVPLNQIYYRKGGTALLGLGQYAVVGPREVTRIGWSTNSSSSDPTYAAPAYEPAGAKIVLAPGYGGVQFFDHTTSSGDSASLSNYPDINTIQQPLAIIVAADLKGGTTWDSGWSSNTSAAARLDTLQNSLLKIYGIGFSISEPLPGANYYQEPTIQRNAFNGEMQVTDCYGPLNQIDPTGTGPKFLDQPEDSDQAKDRPLYHNSSLATGTYFGDTQSLKGYKTVLLQRLANPLVPFNKFTNPYLTVDWMPIDLTVFNGQVGPSPNSADPDEKNPPNPPPIRFASRQRNGQLSGASPNYISDFNIWMQQEWSNRVLDEPPVTSSNDSTGTMVFPYQLKYYKDGSNTLPVATNLASPSGTGPGVGLHTFGFVNSYFQQDRSQQPLQGTFGPLTAADVTNNYLQHVGDPRSPFPWLTWNNRPYANIAELMMVPATHPGRLLHEFGLASKTLNPYDYNTGQLAPFSHLLNFFNSDKSSFNSTNLSQMLEYLRVPSPFVGNNMVLDPQTFRGDWWTSPGGGIPGEASSAPNEPVGTAGLHPPFNFVSSYRDPGKVNINTIADQNVWNAIIGGTPNYTNGVVGPVFSYNTTGQPSIEESRRGSPITVSNTNPLAVYSFNAAFPSIFANPFRSGSGADMVPLPGPVSSNGLAHNPANVTLLRASGSDPDTSNTPLFSPANTPNYTQQTYRDPTANAYFDYQVLDRLQNKLTTRSNVFAVWITVGYFEVQTWYGYPTTSGGPYPTSGPEVFDTAHPDGYQLGQELNADTGQIERHRAFYIIDRSIPVGFQRGLDLNDNNAIVLKRFIE